MLYLRGRYIICLMYLCMHCIYSNETNIVPNSDRGSTSRFLFLLDYSNLTVIK